MNKNSFPEAKQIWKGHIAVFTLLAILASMLFSRAIPSICMMLFGLNALWDVHPRRWLRERWWLFGMAWIALYVLSGLWTTNMEVWWDHLQVKGPFLLLPLGFAFLPPFTALQLRAFTWCLMLTMCAGAVYSLSFFWQAGSLVNSYKFAQVLPTPMYNDHIAFAATVALSIAWVLFYLTSMPKRQQIGLLLIVLFLGVYLHVLAAKTGLMMLYILALAVIVHYCRCSIKKGLVLLLIAGGSIALAFTMLPTLRERTGYTMVTWRSYAMGERHGIYSDAGRLISYDLACKSIASHPVSGVGLGDVMDEMRAGYARWYPEVPEAQKLWPHNQFLTCGMAAGLPAALLFAVWLALPLRKLKRNRAGYYFLTTWIMLLVPLMVDVFLEVQFGVAVFLIFLLWQRKILLDSIATTTLKDSASGTALNHPKSEIRGLNFR